MHKSLAIGLLTMVSIPAAAASLPPCPPGWDGTKWVNPDVQSPKYVVGRIIAAYPHKPSGLKAAMPQIALLYEGSKILPGKGDVALITCVGEIDLIQAADNVTDTGTAWQWLVNKDLCGSCTPRLCSPPAPEGAAKVEAPNMLSIVQASAKEHPEVWAKPASKTADSPRKPQGSSDCREALEYALADLHRADPKWGYDCVDQACVKRSTGTAAYYSGSGDPNEGATTRIRVKIAEGRCDVAAHPVWQMQTDQKSGYWSKTGLVKAGDNTRCTWITERFCLSEGGAEAYVESRTGNGHADCKQGPGPGFTEQGSSWIRMIGNSCPAGAR